ncbi:MAG TPA: hypothetical protein VJ529_04430 [Candidatus Bathyarchaeia archaeon]|nr:hypothetical protein [Candidatus Bathyarchaeia archaeon]
MFRTQEDDPRDFAVGVSPETYGITLHTTDEDGTVRIASINAGVTAPGTYWVWQANVNLYTGEWSYFGYWTIEVGPSLSGDYIIEFMA